MRITGVFFVSGGDTLDLLLPCPCLKVVIVSRLSELLKDLLTRRGLTQADVVRKTEEFGMTVSKGTVSTYFSNPPQRPRRQVLEAFARVFDVPVSDLEDAATFTGREPFAPDPSSDRLTPPQRAVLNELIRVMTDGNEKAGEGNAVSPTPMNQAGGKPATDRQDGPRPVPDLADMAAYDAGETDRQKMRRLDAAQDDESQDPGDWE